MMSSTDVLTGKVVRILSEKGLKISTAESCTGGMLAASIINISGASDVFEEGYITYSDKSKSKLLNVKECTLKTYGAVSKETAMEMAAGCARNAHSDVALVTTGVAGPSGGTKDKPVGLVYIGCCYKDKVITSENVFLGDRLSVRQQTVEKALQMALEIILE